MGFALQTEPLPLQKDPEGTLRVGSTRVTLETVVEAFCEGLTAEEIAQQYPSLDLADVYAVVAYYLRHRDEVEAYMEERRERSEAIRRKIEVRCPPDAFRERLTRRRREMLGA